jgi:hypothetical protein
MPQTSINQGSTLVDTPKNSFSNNMQYVPLHYVEALYKEFAQELAEKDH